MPRPALTLNLIEGFETISKHHSIFDNVTSIFGSLSVWMSLLINEDFRSRSRHAKKITAGI
jgi:hypothetical protein